MLNRAGIFIFGFIAVLFLVRYLSKADFGIYSFYITVVTLIEMSRNSFIQNGFTTHYSKKELVKKEVVTSSLILNGVLTVTLALALYLFSDLIASPNSSNELLKMIKTYCVFSPLMVISSHATYYFTTTTDFKKVAAISLTRYGAFCIIVIGVYFLQEGVTVYEFALLNLISIFISILLSAFYLVRSSYSHAWVFNFKLVKKLFHFGKYTFGVGISSMMTRSIDKFMIKAFLSHEAVATYDIARRFLNILDVPIAAVSNVALPKLVEAGNGDKPNKEIGEVFSKTSGMGIAIIIPVVLLLLLFPAFFIKLVAGDNYLDAVPILQILLVYNLFRPITTQSGGVLEAVGKPKIGFVVLLVNIIINVVLNYFLIRSSAFYGGLIGASIASFVSGFIYLFLLLHYVRKECEYEMSAIFITGIDIYKEAYKMIRTKLR